MLFPAWSTWCVCLCIPSFSNTSSHCLLGNVVGFCQEAERFWITSHSPGCTDNVHNEYWCNTVHLSVCIGISNGLGNVSRPSRYFHCSSHMLQLTCQLLGLAISTHSVYSGLILSKVTRSNNHKGSVELPISLSFTCFLLGFLDTIENMCCPHQNTGVDRILECCLRLKMKYL